MKLAERDQAAAVAAGLPAAATVALTDVAGAIRDGLLAFSCSAGMLVIGQIMAEEMTAKVGLRGHHLPERALRSALPGRPIVAVVLRWCYASPNEHIGTVPRMSVARLRLSGADERQSGP